MGNLNSQLTGSTEVILEVRPSISSSDWTEVDKIGRHLKIVMIRGGDTRKTLHRSLPTTDLRTGLLVRVA